MGVKPSGVRSTAAATTRTRSRAAGGAGAPPPPGEALLPRPEGSRAPTAAASPHPASSPPPFPLTPCSLTPCSLTPSLLALLAACWEAGTDDSARLAARLCQSPETVRTNFKRVNRLLGTSSRCEAVLHALRAGWVPLRGGQGAGGGGDADGVAPG